MQGPSGKALRIALGTGAFHPCGRDSPKRSVAVHGLSARPYDCQPRLADHDAGASAGFTRWSPQWAKALDLRRRAAGSPKQSPGGMVFARLKPSVWCEGTG